MKKIILISILLISVFIANAQTYPIVNRAGSANTIQDARLYALYNLGAPRYLDTATANIVSNRGADSCGTIIYTYVANTLWVRKCSPKRWEQVGSNIDLGLRGVYTNYGLTKVNDSTLNFSTALRDSIIDVSTPNVVGTIYSANTFSSTSDFTVNGATVSASGGNLNFSNGIDNFSQTIGYNQQTLLERWKMTGGFIVTEKTATSYGFGLGVRSTNSTVSSNVNVKFDASTGSNSGKLRIYAYNNTLVKTSDSSVVFDAGDSILLNIERVVDTMYVWATNITKGTTSDVTTYPYRFSTGATIFTQNTGRFSVYSFGGNFSLYNLNVTSLATQKPYLVVEGDSKTAGYFMPTRYQRWADRVSDNFNGLVIQAGSGDKITDLLNRIDETISLDAVQMLLAIGANDIRALVDSNTIKANYSLYTDSIENSGTIVWHLLPFKEAPLDQVWFKNYIIRTYPTRYIDTYTPTEECSNCLVDGVHLNDKGNLIVYNTVANSTGLIGGNQKSVYSISSALARGNTADIPLILGSAKRNGSNWTGSFSQPKIHLTGNYPSISFDTDVSSFGGASLVFRTRSAGYKLNSSLYGDSAYFAITGQGYTGARTLAFFTADATGNNVTGFKIRQPESDFTGARVRTTAEAGQSLYAGFELPTTGTFFNTTSAVFAVNALNFPIDLYNLPSTIIDTTGKKPLVIDPTTGQVTRTNWPNFSSGAAPLFPVTGTGTATGNVTGDMDGNDFVLGNANQASILATSQALLYSSDATGSTAYTTASTDGTNRVVVVGATRPGNIFSEARNYSDSIVFNPAFGNVRFDSLNTQTTLSRLNVMVWDTLTGQTYTTPVANLPGGGGSGITSLNGQTGATQTFTEGYGIDIASGSNNHTFTLDTTTVFPAIRATIPSGGGSSALSGLTAATAGNDISNANFKQNWRWNTLAGDTALALEANTTAAASDAQTLFSARLKGANATSGQFTVALSGSNAHTGTTSENVGVYGSASGGTYNYSGWFNEKLSVGGYSIAAGGEDAALLVRSIDNTTGGIRIANNANYVTHMRLGPSAIQGSDDITVTAIGGDVTFNSLRNYFGGASAATSTIQSANSFAAGITSVSANTTLSVSHYTVLVDATSGNITITLPAASTCSGRIYNIKKTDATANSVTIDGDASETIDGATTQSTTVQWFSFQIQSNGTSWFVLNN